MAEVVAGTLSEVRDAEVLIERPDGSRITVVVNIRPLKNERDDIIGAINCFYDVTARKEDRGGAARIGPPQERVPGDARPRAQESARTNPPLP